MQGEEWCQHIDVEGETYHVTIIRRPFREGLEARIRIGEETITIAELGLGENALLERARAAISSELRRRSTS